MNKLRHKFKPVSLKTDITSGRIDWGKIRGQRSLLGKVIVGVREFIASCTDTDLFGVSAQMAFTTLFALLPTLLFIILICSRFIGDFSQLFLGTLGQMLPTASAEYISSEISYLLGYVRQYRIFIICASALMGTVSSRTIIISLNQVYGFDPYSLRRWEWLKSFGVLLTFCLIVAMLTGLLILTLYAAQNFLTTGHFEIPGTYVEDSLFAVGVIAIVFLLLWALYTFAPQRRVVFTETWPGALVATLGIFLIFEVYVTFLNRSVNYLTVYGSFSGVFVLLTALDFLSMIINIGAKINVLFARR